MAKLVVYFSRADENSFDGSLKYVEVGNTEKVAKRIAALLNCDTFKLEMKEPYPASYEECCNKAMEDLRAKARPELVALPENLDDYNEIYLGFPIYWGTLPMPVYTFLEKFNWQRKQIYPFITHEGSDFGMSTSDLKKAVKGAMVMKGLSIHGKNVDMANMAIEQWALYGM